MTTSKTASIAFVTPFSISSTNNSKLISLLSETKVNLDKRDTTNEAPLPLNFSIPTTSQFDASTLVELNNTRILSQSSEQRNNKQQVSNTAMETVDENDEPKLLIDIDSIMPSNLQEQLSTIVLNNFPNLKNNVIEQVLSNTINFSTDKTPEPRRSFHWSQIDYEFSDLKVVFIRFGKVEDAKWFIETYYRIDTLLPKVELNYSHQVRERLADVPSHPETNQESLKNRLKLMLYASKNFAKPKVHGVEELDQVMQSYSNYKVDYNDLIDVPNEMKEGIIKDIIKFRSRMLLIEKENRQKQIEQERVVTKNKLNELFKGIEKTEQEKKKKEEQSTSEVAIKEEVVTIPEQFESLNDEEYSKMIDEREANEYSQEYQSRLANFSKHHASEKSKLEFKLEKLLNYESNLIELKLSHIENMRNYEKSEVSTLYTYRYNDYLKQRNAKRSLELRMDAEDAAAEEKELTEIEQEPDVPIKKKKLDVNDKLKLSNLPDLQFLTADMKERIHDKINALVEEYLGIQDDFLVDVIKQHIEVNNFGGKAVLVQDLVEVLDEDAGNLVNDLYSFAESIVEK